MSGFPTNSDPNWAFGYVPSPAEWNLDWFNKVDANAGQLLSPTLENAIFTGNVNFGTASVTVSTPAAGNVSNQIANTAFVSGVQMIAAGSTVLRPVASILGDSKSVFDFGAVGDGATDDTAAFNLAAQSGVQIYVPRTPSGYKVSGSITCGNNCSFIGDSAKPYFNTAPGTYTLFHVTGSDVTIANIAIQNIAKTGGVDCLIDCSSGVLNRLHFTNWLALNSYGCIADTGPTTSWYVSTWVDQIQALAVRGTGFEFNHSLAYLFVTDCVASPIGTATLPNFPGFVLDNTTISGNAAVGGSIWRGCSVTGTSVGAGTMSSQVGFTFKNTAEVWVQDCDADTVDAIGYSIINVAGMHIVDSEASLCDGFGLAMSGSTFIDISNFRVFGRNIPAVITGSLTVSGIYLVQQNAVISINNPIVHNCTGHGFLMGPQSGPININGGQMYNNVGYGLNVGNTPAGFLANGMILSLNTAGNYTMSGTFSYIAATVVNSGSITSSGPGPISA